MENTYVAVRFENNNSSKWDGKEAEVPGRTVVRLGRRGEDGLEKAEVSWPGKGKTGKAKVWRCVVLEGEEEEEGQTARMRKPEPETYVQRPAAEDTDTPRTPTAPPRRRGPGKGKSDGLIAAVVDSYRSRAHEDEERARDEEPDEAPEEEPVPKKPRSWSGGRDSVKAKAKAKSRKPKGEQLNFTSIE